MVGLVFGYRFEKVWWVEMMIVFWLDLVYFFMSCCIVIWWWMLCRKDLWCIVSVVDWLVVVLLKILVVLRFVWLYFDMMIGMLLVFVSFLDRIVVLELYLFIVRMLLFERSLM